MRTQFISIIAAAMFVFHIGTPSVAAEAPLVILMPGGKGAPQAIGFLMRNRHQFDRAGIETFVTSTPQQTVQAAKSATVKGRKVFIVGMSIGVIKSASALGQGAL